MKTFITTDTSWIATTPLYEFIARSKEDSLFKMVSFRLGKISRKRSSTPYNRSSFDFSLERPDSGACTRVPENFFVLSDQVFWEAEAEAETDKSTGSKKSEVWSVELGLRSRGQSRLQS